MFTLRTLICLCNLVLAYPALTQNTSVPDLGDNSILRPSGYKPAYPLKSAVINQGRQLFNDSKLSTNGRSCGSCHNEPDSFGPRFRSPYPHAAMNSEVRFGVERMNLDEVIQVCMQGPMRNIPLEWGSPEQKALTTYLLKVQATGKM